MADFNFTPNDNISLVSIAGRFTLLDKDDFQDFLSQHVNLSESDIGIDASALEYVDSSGIGDFIKLKIETAKFSRSVYVYGLKDPALNAFRAAQLDSVINVLSTEEFKEKFSL